MHMQQDGSHRAALYLRVSTDEQAKSGYSIEDQRRELRHWAEREGVAVVAELEDDGYSGASPERPGLRRVLELAAAGEIDMAVATKRDRWFRSRLHRLLFDQDMQDCGVRAIALDDTNNRFADAFLDEYSAHEREVIAQRTQNGKRQAARSGRIVGSSAAPRYGFRYTEDKHAYLVDDRHMQVVRRIFSEVAAGRSLYSVVEGLNRDRIPSPQAQVKPKSAGKWTTATIRGIIRSAAYEPHPFAEVATLVAPEVATRLDEGSSYGLWYYGDIAVPIPHSGIPRRVVRAAREAIKDNRRSSNAGYRTWPLSGGMLRCADCGTSMVSATTTKGKKGTRYNYYRCPCTVRGYPRCENKRLLRAEPTEEMVWAFVSDMVSDPDALLYQWNAELDRQIAELSGDPDKHRRTVAARIVELDDKAKRAKDLAIDGLIDPDELRVRLAQIASERVEAQQELEAASKSAERVAQIEASRDAFPELLQVARERLAGATLEDQRMTYEDFNLRLWARDGEIVNLTGSFERIGYPSEAELNRREEEAFAKLAHEREEREAMGLPPEEDHWSDEAYERAIDAEIRAEVCAELERVERAGVGTSEIRSSVASAPT